ncbi:hypothetical protein N9R86_00670 [Alphaproteobacteria bacterium]|nr:hypothetical protein [Alphaproteobacteria bacterium]
MIYIRVRIFIFLILVLFSNGCSYNYEKELIENNKIPNITISAKSLTVNKDSLIDTSNSNDNIRKINTKLIDEFEVWLYEKFSLSGNENEASIKVQLAEANLIQTKNKTLLKPFLLYKEEVFEINLNFYLMIEKKAYFKNKLQINSSLTFSLRDNMSLFKREKLINATIKKLIKEIDYKMNKSLRSTSFNQVIKIN